MAGLSDFLRYLDRPDVDEVVLQVGKVVALGNAGKYRAITREPIAINQLVALLGSEGLTSYLPTTDGNQRHDILVGARELSMLIRRQGTRLTVRFMTAGVPQETVDIPTDAIPLRGDELTPPPGTLPVPPEPLREPARTREPARAPTPAPASPPTPPAAARVAPSATSRRDVSPSELLRLARAEGASDVHLAVGRTPMVRRAGQLLPEGSKLLEARDLESVVAPMLDGRARQQLDEKGYADFAVELDGVGRVRVNVCRQRLGLKACFRMVAPRPPTLEELGLPAELARVATYHQGLAVVSGPNGHGKTTTMAALVDLINASKPAHIITVEDPVEVIHPVRRALVSQREVGVHTDSFSRALKAALREDPDVICIGELRDRETVEMALSAAETGHLVIATMSTPSGAKTIDRLIDMFPPDDQQQVRATLAGALKIVVSQRLVPSVDGTRLHAAAELITGSIPLWALIRDNKLFQLPSLLQRGRRYGMIRVEDSLALLLERGQIDEATARKFADDPRFFDKKPQDPATVPPGSPAASVKDRLGNLFGRQKP